MIKYLVGYFYDKPRGETGVGRTFITLEKNETLTEEMIVQIEEHIKAKWNMQAVVVTNIIKLESKSLISSYMKTFLVFAATYTGVLLLGSCFGLVASIGDAFVYLITIVSTLQVHSSIRGSNE
jgi:hypothetical protein